MQLLSRVLLGVALCQAAVGAQAALIGLQTAFPDVTLGSSTLIYDANGVNASTGLLRVVSASSTLNRAPGSATPAQSYFGSGDSVANVMLSFAINNSTGAWVSNSTYNKVTIGFGNLAVANPANFGFSWQGNITNFGFLANGTAFDARWTMTADQYQAMPSGFGAYTNGAYTGYSGGMNILNLNGAITSGPNIWAFDWVRGSFAGTEGAAYAAQISPYTGLLAVNADRQQLTDVAVNVWVPIPAAGWLMLTGIGAALPLLRRSRQNKHA